MLTIPLPDGSTLPAAAPFSTSPSETSTSCAPHSPHPGVSSQDQIPYQPSAPCSLALNHPRVPSNSSSNSSLQPTTLRTYVPQPQSNSARKSAAAKSASTAISKNSLIKLEISSPRPLARRYCKSQIFNQARSARSVAARWLRSDYLWLWAITTTTTFPTTKAHTPHYSVPQSSLT